jgi:hypothetical protein
VSDGGFRAGDTYEGVYLVAIDAAGYSTIVDHNPRDRAAHAFDLLRRRALGRVLDSSAERRCMRVALWTWRGDGGLLAIHDDDESIARDVALEAARGLLTLDLPQLREEVGQTELRGEIHIRIAVHKGTIRYSGADRTGLIHSPDINFVVHLEEATPRDCLAVSDDVYRIAGRHAESFAAVGAFEGKEIYVSAASGRAIDAQRAWLAAGGLSNGESVHAYRHRPSQLDKAKLVDVAEHDVLDYGTALRTSVRYLLTTERPAAYRESVLRLLRRGGTYRCVLLHPSCDATAALSKYRDEDLAGKIEETLVQFGKFKRRYGADVDGLHVYQVTQFSGFAALATDVASPLSMVLYSPYLMSMPDYGAYVERADMPHYFVTSTTGELFGDVRDTLVLATAADRMERLL